MVIFTVSFLVLLCIRIFAPSEPISCQIVRNQSSGNEDAPCEIRLLVQCNEKDNDIVEAFSRKTTFCGSYGLSNQNGGFGPFTVSRYGVVFDGKKITYPIGQSITLFKSDGYLFLTAKEWDGMDVFLAISMNALFLFIMSFCGWVLYHWHWRVLRPPNYQHIQNNDNDNNVQEIEMAQTK